jgi:ParB/RepB/Spo0J family partition protein
MATTTTTGTGGMLTIPVAEIHVPENVRELDPEHVDALAGSIALQGILVPLVITPDPGEDGGWLLVAGFHRLAAARQLGLIDVPIVVREHATEASDRSIENIVRKPLSPYEEAVAVREMLARGLTEDGAAQALGWPKARVTARMRLLELPERAQQLTGQGVIPLSAVEELRTIGSVSPELLEVLVEHVDSEDGRWVARELASNPGRALGEALRHSGSKVFAAYLDQVRSYDIEQLRLGKKTGELMVEAEKLHKQITEYAYGPPTIRFGDLEVDQARAAGVLIELDGSTAMITDRSLYRELCKQAIRRTVEDLRARAAELAEQRRTERAAGRTVDPAAEARREHGRRMRQLAEQAHGANLDLGRSLMNGLACVDPASMDVARLLVYSLLADDWDSSPYTQTGDRICELAARGVRLVVEEFRTDVTKTRKDGSRGALRIDYGDPRKPERPIAWVWKWLDSAKTAGDLYGRCIVVLAAEQYASRLVVPQSQQHPPLRWSSHGDRARKALAKLAGPHLPASLKQLEKAVAQAKAEHEHATQHPTRTAPPGNAEVEDEVVGERPEDDELADDDPLDADLDGLADMSDSGQ